MEPPWARTPLRAPWQRMAAQVRRLVAGRNIPLIRPVFRLSDRDNDRLASAQRQRARELAELMGFKRDISDRHADRIIEVLGPFIPGLTIQSPATAPVPDWVGARWTAPEVGRPLRWTHERLRELAADVDHIRAGGVTTDTAALQIIATREREAGRSPPSLKTLLNKLSDARRL